MSTAGVSARWNRSAHRLRRADALTRQRRSRDGRRACYAWAAHGARHCPPCMTTSGGGMGAIVLLPLGVDDSALDRCLAALDAGTAAGTSIWLADDAQAGPRAQALVERWLANTPLQAEYTRRARPLGETAHLDEMLRACDGLDVAVLAPDSVPAPGWLDQLQACFDRDASIATATPWCNAGETVAWPRIGEVNPIPDALEPLAR